MPFSNERRRPQDILPFTAAPFGGECPLAAIAQPVRPPKQRPILGVRGWREDPDQHKPKHNACTAVLVDLGLTSNSECHVALQRATIVPRGDRRPPLALWGM